VVKNGAWPVPAIFRTIRDRGGIGEREMFRTFNMGVGMALVTSAADAAGAVARFARLGQKAWVIGHIEKGTREVILA